MLIWIVEVRILLYTYYTTTLVHINGSSSTLLSLVENGICNYITIQVLVLVLLVCVPEAQGNSDVSAYCASIFRLKPVKRSYARHSPLA